MNLTDPPHVQFVQKPAFGALGMMGHLAELAGPVIRAGSSSGSVCLVSRGRVGDDFYAAVLLTSPDGDDAFRSGKSNGDVIATRLQIELSPHDEPLVWIAEYLEPNITDPFHYWTRDAGRPDYPEAIVRQNMRHRQVNTSIYSRIFNCAMCEELSHEYGNASFASRRILFI